MKSIHQAAALLTACAAIGSAQAALTARDLDGVATTAEAYYDSTLNITWLADWNYAKTSGQDADGVMTWSQAVTWAANLTVGSYTNWRLPASNYSGCHGYNCAGAGQEFGSLWYATLGNAAGALTNSGGFTNLQLDWYWTAEDISMSHAGLWSMNLGYLGDQVKFDNRYVVAVHAGDIGGEVVPADVPEPGSLVLAGLAIALLGATTRRRR
jgi:hypothetical protein